MNWSIFEGHPRSPCARRHSGGAPGVTRCTACARLAFLDRACLAGIAVAAMNSDIVDLRSFYASLLGRLAERSIAMALASVWANLPNERLVGLGYTLPWLDRFGTRRRARVCLHAGDAGRGALAAGRPVVDGAGVRRGTAAGRFLHRPHAAGPSAGACRKPARDAQGDLARAVAGRPAWSSWCPTAVACGRASSIRRSARAGRFRAASWTNCCARPISPRRLGGRRCFSRRRSGAGCCASTICWNAAAAASGRSFPASSSSRRRSGSIRACRWRSAPRAASSCRC